MAVDMNSEIAVRQTVSRLSGVKREVRNGAQRMAATARAELSRHRYEGNAHIEVEYSFNARYGSLDSLVTLVDMPHARPDGSWSRGNALAIEFGHINNWTGKYNEGKYVLTTAFRVHTGL